MTLDELFTKLESDETKNLSDYKKYNLIKHFLKNNDDHVDIDGFFEILKKIDPTARKGILLKSFLENKSTNIDVDDFFKLLEIEEVDDEEKYTLSQLFLSSHSDNIDIDGLLKILKSFEISEEYELDTISIYRSKVGLIHTFFWNKKIDINCLFKTLESAKIEDKNDKCTLIEAFLKNAHTESGVDDLLQILSSFTEDDISEKQKYGLIKAFVSIPNRKITIDQLTNLIDKAGLKYRSDLIILSYTNCLHDNQIKNQIKKIPEKISDIINISNSLYPKNRSLSDDLKIELLKEAIEQFEHYGITFDNRMDNIFDEDERRDVIDIMGNFINEIDSENNVVFDLIGLLKEKRYITEENQLLLLVKGRVHSKYSSLEQIFTNIDQKNPSTDKQLLFEKYLTTESVAELNNLFLENFLQSNHITILDLLSCYDISDNIASFTNLLSPEVIDQIRKDFEPSPDFLLVNKKEIEKLDQLLADGANQIEQKFIPSAILCDYFKEDFKDIDTSKRYELNFTDSAHVDDQTLQKQLNALFNKIIKSEMPKGDDVVEFFTKAFGIDVGNITEVNEKLSSFFKSNKKELVHALTDDKLGLSSLSSSLFSTIDHGCAKNIGSQFTIALYGLILKEEADIALYSIMSQAIIPNILNSGGDVIMTENNPFENKEVRSYHISPNALFKKIAKHFEAEGTSWDLIEKKSARDKYDILLFLEDKLQNNVKEINEASSHITTYLTIEDLCQKSDILKNEMEKVTIPERVIDFYNKILDEANKSQKIVEEEMEKTKGAVSNLIFRIEEGMRGKPTFAPSPIGNLATKLDKTNNLTNNL